MRYALFAILSLAAPLRSFALTWDFADGTTHGWIARQSSAFSSEPLYSQVVDDTWRIAPVPGQRPTVSLSSPLIGKDSALFDRLTLRLRLIHHSPTEHGELRLGWSNAEDRNQWTSHIQPYPIEWEEITLDLRALAADLEQKVTWQDTLFNFSIYMVLYRDSQDLENHPRFLEVDWIQLTGTEELAQGELSPEDIAVEMGPPGTLFAEPDFFPLGESIGTLGSLQKSRGAVGDVDGDGDADLVVAWNRLIDRERHQGWTVASNDGLGGFEPSQDVTFSTTPFSDPIRRMDLRGSDFDGDGLLDLVVAESQTVELWYNWGDGFDPTLQLPKVRLVGLADGDGDGDVDLLVSAGGSQVVLWINDDYDFVRGEEFVLDSEEVHFAYLPAGQPLGEAASLLWNGPRTPGSYQLTRPWAAVQEPPLFFEAAVDRDALHLLADFDGDGTADILGSPMVFHDGYYGLALWRMDTSGVLARHSLLDWQVRPSHAATASDLNGDGLLDIALVDRNLTDGSALMVLLGQRNGAPVLEGYYPLPSEGSQVLTGDVNGDGDTDLIVLGTSPESGHGGVFVFINQGTPATAVASEVATPTAFALGVNYPNPFNPSTTIPLAVPAGAKNVDLTIYNVLGQPLRRVWTGPLSAGEHDLSWDGLDAQGRPVAAGVYMYRLQVDEQTRTRKMVKIE